MYDCTRLREFFNNKFNEIYALKEREMNVIRDRIERIRYIDSELKIMFNKHVPHVPSDPVWHWQVLQLINNSSFTVSSSSIFKSACKNNLQHHLFYHYIAKVLATLCEQFECLSFQC